MRYINPRYLLTYKNGQQATTAINKAVAALVVVRNEATYLNTVNKNTTMSRMQSPAVH